MSSHVAGNKSAGTGSTGTGRDSAKTTNESPARKAPARKTPARKTPARKTTARKTTAGTITAGRKATTEGTASTPRTALVTGASGYIGSRLVAALLGEGWDVSVGGRNPAALAKFDWTDDVKTVPLDVTDPASCRDAFSAIGDSGTVDVAYYLVHAIGQDGYRETDMESARNFATAAKRAGVSKIVYLGGFVPDDDELSEHLASRAEVGEALAVDGIDVVSLRAAIVIGAGSTSFELIRYLADRLPVVPLPTWLDEPVQPIAVDDVLHYLLAAGTGAVPAGGYDIAGPDVLPYRSLVFAYVHAAKLRRIGIRAPLVPTGLAGPVIGQLVPVPDALAADLVASLHNTMTASDDPIRELVPDPPAGRTTVRDAMARSVAGRDEPLRGVRATADPLRLTATDAPWTGGDEASIRRRASDIVSPELWRLVEKLGAAHLLYRWPVAPVVRTNLDVVAAVAGKVLGAGRVLGVAGGGRENRQ